MHETGDEVGGVYPATLLDASAQNFFVPVHILWTVYTKANYPYPAVRQLLLYREKILRPFLVHKPLDLRTF